MARFLASVRVFTFAEPLSGRAPAHRGSSLGGPARAAQARETREASATCSGVGRTPV